MLGRNGAKLWDTPLTWYVYGALEVSWAYSLIHYIRIHILIFEDSMYTTSLIGVFTCLFMILGSKMENRQLRIAWDWLGLLVPLILLLKDVSQGGLLIFILYLLFFSFCLGLGLPSVLSEVMQATNFENRGKVSGLLCVFAFSSVFAFILLGSLLLVALMKALALATYLFKVKFEQLVKVDGYFKAGRRVTLSLFLLWLLFLLIDSIASMNLTVLLNEIDVLILRLFVILIGLPALLVSGFLFDLYGRRLFILTAFLLLGVEYALISLEPSFIILYPVLDGVSWGFLTVFFTLVVWSDISPPEERELYYVLGLSPPFLANAFSELYRVIGPRIEFWQLFPLVSLFLFMAALAMFFIPETMPEAVLERKRMERYIKSAKRFKERRV